MMNATFYSLDTPVGPLMIVPCMHPGSNAERPDIGIGQSCPDHARTVYLCLDNDALWCDGGPDADGVYHPHELALTSDGGRELDEWDPRPSDEP
jgi:hypothetical protein